MMLSVRCETDTVKRRVFLKIILGDLAFRDLRFMPRFLLRKTCTLLSILFP